MEEQIPQRITLAEAARRSGHSPVSLRQAAQRGTLKAEKVGEGNRATWYTTEAALSAYLKQRYSWKTHGAGISDDGDREEAR